MSSRTASLENIGFAALSLGFGLLLFQPSARADDSAAHALAEKFAGGPDAPAKVTGTATENSAAATAVKDEAKSSADEARAAAAEARAAADRLRLEESEMLARARAEAAAHDKAAARKVAQEADAKRRKTEQAEAARAKAEDDQRLAADSASDAAKQQALSAEREDEARRLVEKLDRAREARSSPGIMALGAAPLDPDKATEAASGFLSLGASHTHNRVAVLLVMEPGDRGIRRFNKTADPILCLGANCYVSTGAGTPASETTRFNAFGPFNTFGRRAGACRRSLTCVFRGIELTGGSASLEPVDLKVLIHDRRPAAMAEPDASCSVTSGQLRCAATIGGKGWRAWVVPEAVAEEAGAAALTTALRTGLPGSNAVALQNPPGR